MKRDIIIPNGNYNIPQKRWLEIVIMQTLVIGTPVLGICIILYNTIKSTNQLVNLSACALSIFILLSGLLALEYRIKDKLWLEIRNKYFDKQGNPKDIIPEQTTTIYGILDNFIKEQNKR